MEDFAEAAARDLLSQRRWHKWPQASEMGIDEFQAATVEEIKAMLARGNILCSDEDAAEIAARLWRKLRD